MRRFKNKVKVLNYLMACFLLLSLPAYSQDSSSSNSPKDNAIGNLILTKHVPHIVEVPGLSQIIAHTDSSQKLDLRFILHSKDQAGLEKFIGEVYNPNSPNYHQYLNPDQFDLMYGASSTDIAIVKRYLNSHHIKVTKQSKNGIVISAEGTVAAVEPTFNTRINDYRRLKDGALFHAPEVNPTLEPLLAGKVDMIVGLDNVPLKFYPHFHREKVLQALPPKTLTVRTPAVTGPRLGGIVIPKAVVNNQPAVNPQFTASPQGFLGFGGSMGPSDIAYGYNLTPIASNGSGQSIALFELDAYRVQDITDFTTQYYGGSYVAPLTNICTDTGAGPDPNETNPCSGISPAGSTDEVVMDIDMAVAVAPGLSHVYVYEAANTGSGWVDQWTNIAADDLAKVISCSWGGDEVGSYPYYDHTIFSQLAAQGQSVFASAGDAGAYDNCEGGTLPPSCVDPSTGDPTTGVLSVDDPASDPHITGVGISILTFNNPGSTSPAESYASETSSLYGGGGVSGYVSIQSPNPTYQAAAAASYYNATTTSCGGGQCGSKTMRNVPDVSLTADQATYYGIHLSGIVYQSDMENAYSVGQKAHADAIYAWLQSNNYVDAYGNIIVDINSGAFTTALDNAFPADFSTVMTVLQQALTGLWYGYWGSSLASPIWAAFTTLVNEGRVAAGQSYIGWLNPVLYQVAGTSRYSTDFHDITTGTNSYYPAKSGYDDATGLGSFNGAFLYNDLVGPSAPTAVSAAAGNLQATVSFTPPTPNGGFANLYYTATSSPGSFTATATSSPVTVMGLTNGTPYTFTVFATNALGAGGTSSASSAVSPNIVPNAPTGVSAAAGNAQATVSFTAPASNGGTAILSYTVTSSPGSFTATGTSSPITVTGLTNGQAYTFNVFATNAMGAGTASSASLAVTPSGLPSAPTSVSAAAGNTQATVSFTPGSANGSSIIDYTATSSPGSFTATAASSPIIVTGLTNGQAYTFTVTETTTAGTSTASLATTAVTPNIVPNAPTGVSATAGNTQATVSFSAPASNGGTAVLSYKVTSSPGSFTATGTTSPITVTGLTNGQAYTFTVVATNAMGAGAASSASSGVTPNIVPNAPTGVSATAGNTQATVSFTAPASNGGTAVLSYTVTSSPGAFTAAGTTSPITVTGLTNGQAYTFTVVATNAMGAGATSSASSAIIPNIVPGAPANPITATAGNTQATVSFGAAPTNGGTAVLSYTATSSPGSFTAASPTSPITVTGLTNGQAYTFTVTATNITGSGLASSTSNSVTPAGLPSAPTLVSASAGNAQASVSFTPGSANGSAIISYTATSSPGSFTATGTTSPIVVAGLTNGQAYTFTVTETNGVGTSSASSASSAVTPNILPNAPTSVSAVAGNNQATVSFTAPASNGGTAVLSYTVTSSPGSFTATGTTSPIIVPGLTNGQAYTFTVVAINAMGTGAASSASSAVTPAGLPAAPTSVSAAPGNTQATVSFTPGSSNGSAIISYTATSSPGSFTATGTTSPIIVPGLTNGQAYTFTVTGTNGVGTSSASSASSAVTPNILPNAPTSVSATAGNTQATVSFTAPASNGGTAVLSYTVTSSPGSFTATGTTSPIVVAGLTNGQAYTFSVVAINAMGTGAASSASSAVTPNIVPNAPTGITATAGNAQATVSFTAPASNGGTAVLSYTVTSSPGSFTATGTTSPIIVSGLTNGQAYTFTVVAVNAMGTGATSSASSAVTPNILPNAPTSVSAVAGNNQATVSFTAPASNGGTAVLSYTVTSSPGSFTATGTTSPIVVAGLTNGQAYTFTVVAINAMGTGAASSASSAVTPAGLPAAPTSVSAAPGNIQATVSFTPGSANGSSIIEYTATSSPGAFTATGTASPIVVAGLTNGQAYTFTVTETNGVGTSSASSASSAVTPNILPNAPTSVSAIAGDTTASVSFTAPASNGGTAILSYTVTSSPGSLTAAGVTSPITVSGLTNGQAYTFRVVAVNAMGAGAASSASSAVTPAGLPAAPTSVSAAPGNTQATVSFTPGSANGSSIIEYTATSSPGAFTATSTTSPIVVAGLTNGQAYTFTVTETNGVGTSSASSASSVAIPNIVPNAPTGVSAIAGNSTASVSFTAPASNGGTAILSYTVTSSPGSLTAAGVSSPITISGLTNGQAYTFTVVAVNEMGAGTVSSPTSAVIPAGPPSAPTTVSAQAGNAQATVTFSGASANGNAITSYAVTSSPDNITVTGSSSPITVTGLTNFTTYTFTVTSTNGLGTSGASVASNSVTPTPAPIPGVCGSANKTYANGTSNWGTDTLCSVGTPDNPSIAFPAAGKSASWVCQGINRGAPASCSGTQNPKIIFRF